MKMTKDDYKDLEIAVNVCTAMYPDMRSDYKNSGLSDERYRWDIFSLAKRALKVDLYKYLNDDHIDTALRHILP